MDGKSHVVWCHKQAQNEGLQWEEDLFYRPLLLLGHIYIYIYIISIYVSWSRGVHTSNFSTSPWKSMRATALVKRWVFCFSGLGGSMRSTKCSMLPCVFSMLHAAFPGRAGASLSPRNSSSCESPGLLVTWLSVRGCAFLREINSGSCL